MAKILVVEDEQPILHAYAFVLGKKGHQVFLADDARKGIELAKSEQPDIILLDMMMPGLSGLDLLKALDVKKTLPNTKLVVMSNIESPKIIQQAKRLGAVKYLLKIDYTPYQVEDIIQKL
jgi:CheY-like chemotaxis protein